VLVLAVDGGATSTRALLGTVEGRLLGFGTAGATGEMKSAGGRRRLHDALAAAVDRALTQAALERPAVASCWLGLTGVFDADDEQTAAASIREHLACDSVGVSDDLEVALAGAAATGPGVIVYAGTGSGAYGIDGAGGRARVGGGGYLVGDHGGAFWIGRSALQATLRAADGRGPRTSLAERLLVAAEAERLGEMLARLYALDFADVRSRVAALAPSVAAAAAAGDGVALTILDQAGRHLAELADAALRRLPGLGRPQPVFVAGGVFRSGALVRVPFERALRRRAPTADVRSAAFPPVVGGYLLALARLGRPATPATLARIAEQVGVLRRSGSDVVSC
jgi:glucosamine kinase